MSCALSMCSSTSLVLILPRKGYHIYVIFCVVRDPRDKITEILVQHTERLLINSLCAHSATEEACGNWANVKSWTTTLLPSQPGTAEYPDRWKQVRSLVQSASLFKIHSAIFETIVALIAKALSTAFNQSTAEPQPGLLL